MNGIPWRPLTRLKKIKAHGCGSERPPPPLMLSLGAKTQEQPQRSPDGRSSVVSLSPMVVEAPSEGVLKRHNCPSRSLQYIALRGVAGIYTDVLRCGIEQRCGKHSNFYDGKIDARIVAVIKRDMADDALTQSRKFSKTLLAYLAEACMTQGSGVTCATFTTANISRIQAETAAAAPPSTAAGACSQRLHA